jgi:hypothetical protein
MRHTPSPARISPRRVALAFGVVALLSGLALVTGVIFPAPAEWRLARRGLVVEGTVVEKRIDHVTRRKAFGRAEDNRLYVVHYAFATRRGETADGEQAVGEARWRSLTQNGPVAVRYLETDPQTSRLDAESREASAVLPATGGMLVAGGLVVLLLTLWRRA